MVSFHLAFPPISYMHSSSPPFVLQAQPIKDLLSCIILGPYIKCRSRVISSCARYVVTNCKKVQLARPSGLWYDAGCQDGTKFPEEHNVFSMFVLSQMLVHGVITRSPTFSVGTSAVIKRMRRGWPQISLTFILNFV
jgi:hypothetical protein